jgi:hypothetical protein
MCNLTCSESAIAAELSRWISSQFAGTVGVSLGWEFSATQLAYPELYIRLNLQIAEIRQHVVKSHPDLAT